MQLSRYTFPERRVRRSGLEARTTNAWLAVVVPAPKPGELRGEAPRLRTIGGRPVGRGLVETTGLEPVTFSVQGRRSPN
jgi:hypothetical protein